MDQKVSGEKALSNFIWRLMERVGAKGVTVIVSIVLARLLDPAVYGTVALVTVFTQILEVFISGGLGVALVQKQDADDLDFSSVFFFNVVMCLLMYGIMFFAAPAIANFYEKPDLVPLIRVLSLILVISGVKNIQESYVSRNLIFKRFFFATLGGTIGAAVIGIWMAYRGYGVWALVAQTLFNALVDTVILWITVGWRPKWMFSFERLGTLLKYGWKLLASDLVDTVYRRLSSLFIGKMYTEDMLAFYNRGEQLPQLLIGNITAAVDSVLMPTLAREQDDREAMKHKMIRSISISTFIMMPMMAGLAACGEPLVRIVLTDKWSPCVPYLMIFCLMYMFYPVNSANLNALKANGRSDLFLILEIVKKVIGISALVIAMKQGVFAIAIAVLITDCFETVLNMLPNRTLIGISIWEQCRTVAPNFILSAVMFAAVYAVSFLGLGDWATLGIQIPLGILLYVAGAKLFNRENFEYTLNIVKKLFSKKRGEAVNE